MSGLRISFGLVTLLGLTVSTTAVRAQVAPEQISNFEAAHVTPLAMTSDGGEVLAVNTPNASIEIFDIGATSLTFNRAIKVGLDPVSVRLRNDSEAWVVNHTSDSVSIVDLDAGHVTQTLRVCDEPADVVFAGALSRAYVSCGGDEEVVVYDAATKTELTRIPILGEQPRAMTVSPDGRLVYLAIFESGNGTTILTAKNNRVETNIVQHPDGPYGGQVPIPNEGANYNPPLNPANPAPSGLVSVIVRRDADGIWRDDNDADWTEMVTRGFGNRDRVAGWDLVDRDIAVIDTRDNSVTYRGGALNIAMALDVHPITGDVTAVGTDAENHIRFEPLLNGNFVKVLTSRYSAGGAVSRDDLNPHLDYSTPTLPESERDKSIGDPRGIAWLPDGSRAVVTGMGSNNLVIIDANGNRAGARDTIEVGEGPTGIVMDAALNRVYVLNKFDASVSMVDLGSEREVARTPFSVDPTPIEVRIGRPLVYDTHLTSGTGHVSCASCHVDSKTDRLAWDLGDPSGDMVAVGGVSHHPMKGPLLTMTLVDMVQAPFLHWRGDKPALVDFASTFNNLQGLEAPGTDDEMAMMEAFLATVRTPPNPYRNLDNSYSTNVEMRGPGGEIFRTGNAVLGAERFEGSCRRCHDGHTGRGDNFVQSGSFGGGQFLNPPRWMNFYKRDGLWFRDATASTTGFGFQQDGTFDSTHNQTRSDDLMAFMYSFNGGFPYEPAGLSPETVSVNAHAAVGQQVTLQPGDTEDALLSDLMGLAQAGDIDLAAQMCTDGQRRGFLMQSNGSFLSDRAASTSFAAMVAGANGPVTFTALRTGTGTVFALDEDANGQLDGTTALPGRSCGTDIGGGSDGLVVNGDFVFAGVPSGGWRLVNAANVDGWSSVTGQIEMWNGLFGLQGPDGQSTMIELDARGGSPRDEVFQTITATAGDTVTLRFAFAGRPNVRAASNAFDVLWNGAVVASFSPQGNGQWQEAEIALTSTGADRLAFREGTLSDGVGGLITGVSAQAETGTSQRVNLVENGTFFAANVPQGGWRAVASAAVAGWTKTSGGGGIEVWNGLLGLVGPNGEASMMETDRNGGGAPDTVTQTISAPNGTAVELRLAFAGRPGVNAADTPFEVLWNGAVVGAFAPAPNGVWQETSIDVVSGGTNQLAIREAGANRGSGSLVTGVQAWISVPGDS